MAGLGGDPEAAPAHGAQSALAHQPGDALAAAALAAAPQLPVHPRTPVRRAALATDGRDHEPQQRVGDRARRWAA